MFDYVVISEPHEVDLLSGLEFRTIRAADVEEVCDFLIKHFFPVEPMGTVLGLDAEKEVRPWLKELVDHQIREGVSYIVRNLSDREVAAVCINDVERKVEPDDEEDVNMMTCLNQRPERNPCMLKIGAALGALMDGHDIYSETQLDAVVSLQFLSVNPKFGRRGVAKALVGLVENRCKALGYSLIYSEATSEFSARAFQQCGYYSIDSLNYADFVMPETGEKPFETMTGTHNCVRLMMKHLK